MCRQSMDMLTSVSVTPPGISFLKRLGSTGRNSSHLFITAKRSQESQDDSLTIPLFSGEPTSTSNVQQSLVPSSSILSVNEFPQPQQQCSFAQSVINGNYHHLSPTVFFCQFRRNDMQLKLFYELT